MNILCDLGHKVHAEGNSPSAKVLEEIPWQLYIDGLEAVCAG